MTPSPNEHPEAERVSRPARPEVWNGAPAKAPAQPSASIAAPVSANGHGRHDPYPSRSGLAPHFVDRIEPVVRGTAADGPLTTAQLDEFDERGLLHFLDIFSEDEVARMAQEMEQLAADPTVRAEESTILDEAGSVRSVFEFPRHSDSLSALMSDERVAGAARQIVGSDVYLHQTRINYKPGFGGGGFDWHSDFETWHTEDGMPEMRAVSASILLTDNHHQNGPLMLVPGSHQTFLVAEEETPEDNYRESLVRQQVGVADRGLFEIMYRQHGIYTATGGAGSLILFESNTLHGSNGNITPDPRSNVFAVFNSVENELVEPYAASRPRPEWLAHRARMQRVGS